MPPAGLKKRFGLLKYRPEEPPVSKMLAKPKIEGPRIAPRALIRAYFWQEREDSNPRPLVLETSALTRLSYAPAAHKGLVPLEGLEPPARDLGRRRSIL